MHHLASPFSLDMTGGPGWQWFPAGNVAKDEPSASMPLPLTSRHAAPHKQPLDDGAFRLCSWWLETLPAPSRVISEDPARLRQGSKIDHPVRCIKISSSKAPLLQLCRRSSPLRAALEWPHPALSMAEARMPPSATTPSPSSSITSNVVEGPRLMLSFATALTLVVAHGPYGAKSTKWSLR